MPLDEATRRFAFLMQRDVRQLVERDEARGDAVTYDPISRIVARSGGRGEPFRFYGERLALYSPRDRIFRWAWAGSSSSSSHVELVFREGQSRGVPQLTQSIVADIGENEAMLLVRLGALVANAEGVHVETRESEIELIGLFDRTRPIDGPSKFSVPPPEAAPKPAPAPRYIPHRSLPPVREVFEPRHTSSRPPPPAAPRPAKIREPSRSLFLPVAQAVLATLATTVPDYRQALFVLSVTGDATGKRRLIVGLVVLDAEGLLRALDPAESLVEDAARLVDADREDGNGPWRKLSARITPKPDGGATLHVDVL
jgi:hypothetical protein